MTETIPIDRISTEGTQTRASLNDTVIAEYAEAYEQGIELPPIEVYFDQETYWLADGFHRLRAAQQIGRDSIAANVHQGSQRDALLSALGKNEDHGLRRNDADRRNAIRILLTDSEWSQWSNSEIARQCRVSEHLVRTVLDEIKPRETERVREETKKVRRRGKEYTMRTGSIGTSRKTSTVEPPATAVEQPVPPVTKVASALPAETVSSPTSKMQPDVSTIAPLQDPPAEITPVTLTNTEPGVLKVVEEAPFSAVSVLSAAAVAELSLEDAWQWATQIDRESFVGNHHDELQKIFRKIEKAATS